MHKRFYTEQKNLLNSLSRFFCLKYVIAFLKLLFVNHHSIFFLPAKYCLVRQSA